MSTMIRKQETAVFDAPVYSFHVQQWLATLPEAAVIVMAKPFEPDDNQKTLTIEASWLVEMNQDGKQIDMEEKSK